MSQEKDALAALLAYVFACDIREHPMPLRRQQQLVACVEKLTQTMGQEEGTDRGKEQNNGTGDTGPAG